MPEKKDESARPNGGPRPTDPLLSPGARLRALMAGDDPVVAPGAYDGLSARLIEAAGFPALCMGGYAVTASRLGRPDVGLLTMTEMVEQARYIAGAVGIPVIADADNGHGNPLNVRRTVREFEAAGVAGVHIEDQVLPKRCGHMEGKQVVSLEEMTAKIRAAVEARRDSDFVIIARTDARATHGLEEAVRRGQACLQAGADVIFVEAPTTMEEMRQIAGSLQAPLFFNWARTGKSPLPPFQEVAALGYKIIAIPLDILYASWFAVREVLAAMAAEGTSAALAARMPTFEEFNRFVGLGEYRELEERYGVAAGFSVKRELGR